jgi:hypothetical protein
VDGKTYSQPIDVKLDPRVTISQADLATLTRLSLEMYDGARAARAAYDAARALSSQLAGVTGEGVAEFKAAVDAIAPPPAAGGGGGRGSFGGGPGGPVASAVATTLNGVSAAMLAAAMAMQGADAAPTAREVAACDAARTQSAGVMARYTKLTTTDLAALNAKRKAAGLPEIGK